jgi:signal peptidase I
MNEPDSNPLPAPIDPERFSPPEPERFQSPATPRSWRTLVGTPPPHRSAAEHVATGEPAGRPPAEPDTTADGGIDTTVGTLGDEPMGGVPPAEPAPPPPREAPRSAATTLTITRVGEEALAWLKTLASAAVYATLIVTFVFQVARVEGQSMAPTLADQDRLIVNKLAYRLGEPQVGDIVMLYYPLNPEKSFVKRVIAEEGDAIRIVDGRVYRNDVLINDDYVPPEFRSHDDYGPEVVPQGYYFVMGDHRNNSSDSRHWKYVPKKYIIGKVQLRWWPLPAARVF